MKLTPRQREVLKRSTARINLYYGSVRSGKTVLSMLWWAAFVRSKPKTANFLMVGKTLTTLKNNILTEMQKLEPSFTFSVSAKRAELYGRTICLEGANDERSENKIRGMTLTGAYLDELTLIPEGFFSMVLSRLSERGAKLIATTNPDAPTNYVFTNIIQNNDIDKAVFKFHLDDNIYLDKTYVEEIKREYVGVYKRLYIDGDFVRAEGVVFPLLADNPEQFMIDRQDLPRTYVWCEMGFDIGGSGSAYAMTCSAMGHDGVIYVLGARKKQAQNVPMEQVDKYAFGFINEIEREHKLVIDTVNADHVDVVINTLNERRYIFGKTYKPPLEDRPFQLNILLAQGRLKFVRGACDDLVDELQNAVFDEKAEKGIILDDGSMQIDTIDSFVYSLASDWHYLNN